MILDIALGIVLAVVILAFLPVIVTAAGAVVLVALVALLGLLAYRFLSGLGVSELGFSEAADLSVLVAIPAALVALVWLAERYTKVSGAEVVGLAFLLPALGHVAALLYGDLSGAPGGSSDHIAVRFFGLAAVSTPTLWIAWRVRSRYRVSV